MPPSQPSPAIVVTNTSNPSILGIAALIMTIFGFFWLGWGFSAEPSFTPVQWILFYVAFLALLSASIVAFRRGKKSMRGEDESLARARKRFRLVTIAEGVGCGIVVLLAVVFHRLDLLAAGISLVVGIHFIPLAALFRFPAYYATGTAILLGDIVSLAMFRSDAMTASAAIATGTVLWVTAIYALARRHSRA